MTLRRHRQKESHSFEASLGYIVSLIPDPISEQKHKYIEYICDMYVMKLFKPEHSYLPFLMLTLKLT